MAVKFDVRVTHVNLAAPGSGRRIIMSPTVRSIIAAALFVASFQAIDSVTVESVVRGAAEILAEQYFDIPLSATVSTELKHRLEAGRYAMLQTHEAIADRLTRDLFELTRDKHVAVRLRRTGGGNITTGARDVPTAAGFRRTDVLPGNVGLLDIAFFLRPAEHAGALAEAMKQLQNTDALILDMRENGGGSPDTVALLISYLVNETGRPLFEIRPRTGTGRVYLTESVSSGLRNGQRPVYVLTSRQSFSGGEGLAFVLQDMKRAIVIGEVTAGAANPGRGYPINDNFEIHVSNGQLLTSQSGLNWEGHGVTPDVPVPAADALRIAHQRAIDDLLSRTPAGPKRQELARVRRTMNGK